MSIRFRQNTGASLYDNLSLSKNPRVLNAAITRRPFTTRCTLERKIMQREENAGGHHAVPFTDSAVIEFSRSCQKK